jgi:type IV pilus assembly protein PilF
MDKAMAKYIFPTLLAAVCMSLISGCVTQSFENDEPILKTQANRDEMAATRVSLGLGYLGMGDMSQAKLNLEKAKVFSPNLVQVHTAFAHYYETVGEGSLAIESFEQALAIKADSADTLNNYGVFLCRQGDVEAAEVQFLKAIAVPSYLLVAQSYENLASCYLQNDDFEKAEMYLNKAIYHSPNRTATLLQMVRLQYAMADYKESKRFLQKFERNTQRFTADSLALAYKLYRKLGQRRTASNYANMLVKMYPQSWEGKQYLLNELDFIEADNLADKYKSTQKQKNRHLPSSSNKRVVKLSPKKPGNSPYIASVNAIASPAMSVKTTADNKTATIASTLPLVAATVTQSTLNDRAAILSTPVAGTVDAKTTVSSGSVSETTLVSNDVVTSTAMVKNTTVAKTFVEETAEVAFTATVVEQVTQAGVSQIEPTSTQPIAATRDVALPEPIEPEVVVSEKVKNIEEVTAQETFHKVIRGENLYSISMKYNVKLSALRAWNNISEKNKIRIGKKLYVVDPQTVKKIND